MNRAEEFGFRVRALNKQLIESWHVEPWRCDHRDWYLATHSELTAAALRVMVMPRVGSLAARSALWPIVTSSDAPTFRKLCARHPVFQITLSGVTDGYSAATLQPHIITICGNVAVSSCSDAWSVRVRQLSDELMRAFDIFRSTDDNAGTIRDARLLVGDLHYSSPIGVIAFNVRVNAPSRSSRQSGRLRLRLRFPKASYPQPFIHSTSLPNS
jgi:hypothetical protein